MRVTRRRPVPGQEKSRPATGATRWTFDGPTPFESGVVVIADVAVVASGAGDIIGLDARTGTLRWRFNIGGSSITEQITTDGSCAFVSVAAVMCVEASGKVRWETGGAANDGTLYITPVRSVGDRLYIGSLSGFHALTVGR